MLPSRRPQISVFFRSDRLRSGRHAFTFTFFYGDFLVGGQRAYFIDGSGGPANFDGLDRGGGAETEVQPGIAGGFKTRIGPHFGRLSPSSRFDLDSRSEPVTIGSHPRGLDPQPVACALGCVAEP